MIRTRVGYTGGTKKNPTYYEMGDHSETIQIDFDPSQISYEELLNIFWVSHDPTGRPWSRQYMSAIFYHSEAQKKLAMETKARMEDRLKEKTWTEIQPAKEFYLAELYHQKYWLLQHPGLLKEFRQIYSKPKDLISSTAVARVNGYLGGHGSHEALKKDLNDLGLSPEGRTRLVEIIGVSEPE